jgi:hypothetical protein
MLPPGSAKFRPVSPPATYTTYPVPPAFIGDRMSISAGSGVADVGAGRAPGTWG